MSGKDMIDWKFLWLTMRMKERFVNVEIDCFI